MFKILCPLIKEKGREMCGLCSGQRWRWTLLFIQEGPEPLGGEQREKGLIWWSWQVLLTDSQTPLLPGTMGGALTVSGTVIPLLLVFPHAVLAAFTVRMALPPPPLQ